MTNSMLKNDPLWFKNSIIYEVPVRAFADSNGDGISDFRGLTEKLDYLQDLGVTTVWLLPCQNASNEVARKVNAIIV